MPKRLPKKSENHQLGKKIELTRIQQLIGQRMLVSKLTKPCFHIEARADVTEMLELRHTFRRKLRTNVSTNDFYIKALSIAAEQFPLITGRLHKDHIHLAKSVNIGFAVEASQGLVAPVLKKTEKMDLVEITKAAKLLIQKSRANKLTNRNMLGASIILSNLGTHNIDSFFAVLPPDANAIVAVGKILETLVPKESGIITRKQVVFGLSADARVVNSHYAARFLEFAIDLLQNTRRLIPNKNLDLFV